MRKILIIVLISIFALIDRIHSMEIVTEKLTDHNEHDNDVPKVSDERHQLEMTTVKSMKKALLKATGSFVLKADRTKPMEDFVDNLPKRPLHTLKEVRAKLNVPGLRIKKQEILEPKRGNFANFVDDSLSDENGYHMPEVDDMNTDISEFFDSSEEKYDNDKNHDVWEVRKGEWILCQVVSKSNQKYAPFCKNCYVCRNIIKLNKELNVRSSSAEDNNQDNDDDDDDNENRKIDSTAVKDDMQARRPGRRPGVHPRPHLGPRPKPRPAVASVASILHKKKPLESPLKSKLIHPTAILPPLSHTHPFSKKDSQSNLIEKVQKDRESETMTILKRAYNEKRISLKEYLTILNNLVYLSNKPLLRVQGTMIPHDSRVLATGKRNADSETTVEPQKVDVTTSLPLPATTFQPVFDQISE